MVRSARLIIPQGVADISQPLSDTSSGGGSFERINLKLSKMKLKIQNPFKAWIESYARRQRELAIEQVNKDVQLREFEGKIWLCYGNTPIVEQNQLRDTLCNTLASTREAVCRYYKL